MTAKTQENFKKNENTKTPSKFDDQNLRKAKDSQATSDKEKSSSQDHEQKDKKSSGSCCG